MQCGRRIKQRGFDRKKQGIHGYPVFLLLFWNDFFHVFLEFCSGQHDHVSAAAAFDAKINAGSEDFPLGRAAGVAFFHLHNISDRKIHTLRLLHQMDNLLREGDFDALCIKAVFDAAAQLRFHSVIHFYLAFCYNFNGNGGIIQTDDTCNGGGFQHSLHICGFLHLILQNGNGAVDAFAIGNADGDNGVDKFAAVIGDRTDRAIRDDAQRRRNRAALWNAG